jgi:hypothetical protein
VYILSREQLRRWFYVEKLPRAALVQRYLQECGVFADGAHLEQWLKAPKQQLDVLKEDNESIHQHACGEYVLAQLQEGVTPKDLLPKLMWEYLVTSTESRLRAYRFYREKLEGYWTAENLERLHWEFLYSQVSLEQEVVRGRGGQNHCNRSRIAAIRTALAARIDTAEELITFRELSVFFQKNEKHAQLALRYPSATVVKDAVPKYLVDAYKKTFTTGFMETPFAYWRKYSHSSAEKVASLGYIAYPKVSADACLVAAFVLGQCQEVYERQCFLGSMLTPVQRCFTQKYPSIDFYFWVQYGSWSCCHDCGSSK